MAAVEEELEPQVAAAGDAADVVDSDPGAPLLLAGNWLSLDLHPWGCRRLLHLCAQQTPQLREVEFLQLSGHEDPRLLEATLARVPESLPHLRSLIIKGEPHLVPALSHLHLQLLPLLLVLKGQPQSHPITVLHAAEPSPLPAAWCWLSSWALKLPSGVLQQTPVCTLFPGWGGVLTVHQDEPSVWVPASLHLPAPVRQTWGSGPPCMQLLPCVPGRQGHAGTWG